MKLPDGWKEVKLGNILLRVDYGSAAKSNFSGKCPVLRMGNLKDGKLDWSDLVYTSSVDEIKKYQLEAGDILFNRTNSRDLVGKTAIYTNEHPAIFAGYLIRLRVKKECDAFFLNYYMNSEKFISFCKAVRTDAIGQSNINAQSLQCFKFLLPPLSEQKRIADTLSVWDSMIGKTEKLIENDIKKYKCLIYKLIQQPSDRNVWQKTKLEQILKEGSKTPVTDTSQYRKITVKLHKKGIEFADLTREMADTRPFYIRRSGELIIGKQNYFNGSVALVGDEFDGCICSNAIMSFGISDKVNSRFLYEAVSHDKYLKRREALANGTGQKELTEKDFLNFEVALPSFTEQTTIADTLDVAQHAIDLLRQLAEQYKFQKQGLMQKLLTGQWRIR